MATEHWARVKCPRCAGQIAATDTKCGRCGLNLDRVVSPVVGDVLPEPAPETEVAAPVEPPAHAGLPYRLAGLAMFAAGAVVVLVALVLLVVSR